jgi:putative endonuclease
VNKYFVYILYSSKIDAFYVGQTINTGIRLIDHLSHNIDNAFTKRAHDWKLFYELECNSRRQAILVEKHLKKMKSRHYLQNLKKYPEIGNKLLQKYKEPSDLNENPINL